MPNYETAATALTQARFDRNMAWLHQAAPSIHERLAAMPAPAGRIVAEPTDPTDVNFHVDHRLFFSGGAGAQARRDVVAFLAAPEKIVWPPLQAGGKSPIVDPLRERVDAFVAATGRATGGMPAHHRATALVALGVGLGIHLAHLIEILDVRHIGAVERIPDFLWNSLWLQDRAGWDDLLRSRGDALSLVVEDDPEDAANLIDWDLAEHCMPTIEGTHVHQGYASSILHCNKLDLYARLRSTRGEGFFEEEIRMPVNASTNLARGNVRLADALDAMADEVDQAVASAMAKKGDQR